MDKISLLLVQEYDMEVGGRRTGTSREVQMEELKDMKDCWSQFCLDAQSLCGNILWEIFESVRPIFMTRVHMQRKGMRRK